MYEIFYDLLRFITISLRLAVEQAQWPAIRLVPYFFPLYGLYRPSLTIYGALWELCNMEFLNTIFSYLYSHHFIIQIINQT